MTVTTGKHKRFHWAAEVLAVQPGELLLEIGCGAGLLAEMVVQTLSGGMLTAVDRSEAMIRQATKRNQPSIANGKMQLLQGSFHTVDLPKEAFDKIFAFNVRSLWDNTAGELALLQALLKVQGHFYLFFQPPTDTTQQLAAEAALSMEKGGFQVVEVLFLELQPAPAFCIYAVRGG